MLNFNLKKIIMILLCAILCSCATLRTKSELAQGERYFKGGLYKHAMKQLLPLAVDGNANAQYAVGYMYYYGYGVTQDTDTGYFWINRAAQQHYEPALKALAVAKKKK